MKPNQVTHLNGPFRGFSPVAFAFVAIFGLLSESRAQDPLAAFEDTLIKVIERAEPSVVSIARFRLKMETFPTNQFEAAHKPFGGRNESRQKGEYDDLPNDFGAGFLISPYKSLDRLILTNYHVVRGGPVHPRFGTDDGTELRIQLSDRRACLGAIVAADPRSDLAVLSLNWDQAKIKPTDFPCLNWEDASPPRKGQFALLLGNPYAIARDGSASVSWGLISNLTRQPVSLAHNQFPTSEEDANNSMLYRLGLVMQLDARLNLGTSGGPVLNRKGELIGISTSLAAIEGYEKSVGYAIPVDPLTRRIIRTLLAGQEVEYGMLGITPDEIPPEIFQGLDTGLPQRSAALVKTVHPGSPANRVGISQGDILVSVQGVPVHSVADLMRMVGLHPPESEIEIGVLRRNRPRPEQHLESLRIKLGKWPVKDSEGIIETKPRHPVWRGLTVDYATARSQQLPQSVDYNRVLVTKVEDGSPCHTARLERGNFITHVNEFAVSTPAEFAAATKNVSGNVTLRLSDDYGESNARRIVIVREQ